MSIFFNSQFSSGLRNAWVKTYWRWLRLEINIKIVKSKISYDYIPTATLTYEMHNEKYITMQCNITVDKNHYFLSTQKVIYMFL